MRRSWMLTIAALLLLSLLPAGAAAHGSVPLSEAVTGLRTEDGGQGWVLKANFGLITSTDTDHYICEESFSGGARFEVAVLGMHEWVIFTEDRIVRSPDGCTYTEIKSLPQAISDYALDRRDGRLAYVINGMSGSELWISEDRGKSFSKVDLDTVGVSLTQVDFVSNGRILLSAYVNETGYGHPLGTAKLWVVKDGTLQTEKTISEYKYPYVLAARGNQVAWLAGTGMGQKIIWGTVDSPEGRSKKINSWPTGALFEPSGDVLWVAGVGAEGGSKGFLKGTRSDGSISFEFAHPKHSAACVGYGGDALYACGRWGAEGTDLQRLMGGSFTALANFNDLKGPRQDCPADSAVAMTCPTVWPELKKAINNVRGGGGDTGPDAGGEVGPDAGGPDAGGSDTGASQGDTGSDVHPGDTAVSDAGADGGTGSGGTGGNGSGSKDSGCSTAGGGPTGGAWLVVLALAAVAAGRRHPR